VYTLTTDAYLEHKYSISLFYGKSIITGVGQFARLPKSSKFFLIKYTVIETNGNVGSVNNYHLFHETLGIRTDIIYYFTFTLLSFTELVCYVTNVFDRQLCIGTGTRIIFQTY
jgi:hypothetical protein